MWICPKCGAEFVQKNLWHSCVRRTESSFLLNKPLETVALYKYFLKEYRKIGPIKLHVAKTRIAFMLYTKSDVDKEFIKYMKMAYRVGERKHLIK